MIDFSQLYSSDIAKKMLRETLREVVATARQQGLTDDVIADQLLWSALGETFRNKVDGIKWAEDALVAVEYVADESWKTMDELLRFVGDRPLNARPFRRPRKRPSGRKSE